jgi:hypothetical protein
MQLRVLASKNILSVQYLCKHLIKYNNDYEKKYIHFPINPSCSSAERKD